MNVKSIQAVTRYTPDCSIHATAEIAFMRESENGLYVSLSDYMALDEHAKILDGMMDDIVNELHEKKWETERLRHQLFKERHPFLSGFLWVKCLFNRGRE